MTTNKPLAVYLAAGLFNSAERMRNAQVGALLQKFRREVILPQATAPQFLIEGKGFDLKALSADCASHAANPKNVTVLIADGPTADDGGSVELGIAWAKTGRAIVVRTDIRTDTKKEIGLNGMFNLPGILQVICPCLAITELQVFEFHQRLGQHIEVAMQKIEEKESK